jgi:hypothetical protein
MARLAGEEHAVGGAAGANAAADSLWIDVVEIPDGVDLDLASFAAMPDQAAADLSYTRGISNALLDMVRDIALLAADGDADAARFVSKGGWNRARDDGGFGCPSAERLRQKLSVRHWHQALAVAFLSPKERAGTLGSYRKRVSIVNGFHKGLLYCRGGRRLRRSAGSRGGCAWWWLRTPRLCRLR